ncbi:hypothetical protein MVEN_01287700 [Mycena venus]|uniref:Uncharacterized protein n=1 Tax=Mycena venus TaxID=2733690 RepID=A0A8H7CVN5_9AGAR|nr:hypothetical protein MVEN_01287700 [Mycena venus]
MFGAELNVAVGLDVVEPIEKDATGDILVKNKLLMDVGIFFTGCPQDDAYTDILVKLRPVKPINRWFEVYQESLDRRSFRSLHPPLARLRRSPPVLAQSSLHAFSVPVVLLPPHSRLVPLTSSLDLPRLPIHPVLQFVAHPHPHILGRPAPPRPPFPPRSDTRLHTMLKRRSKSETGGETVRGRLEDGHGLVGGGAAVKFNPREVSVRTSGGLSYLPMDRRRSVLPCCLLFLSNAVDGNVSRIQ